MKMAAGKTHDSRQQSLNPPTSFFLISALVYVSSFTVDALEDSLDLEKIYSDKDGNLRYCDIFPLAWSNFSRCVLQSYEPWVVLFHRGMLGEDWKRTAVALRGVVWFGMVDVEKEAELLEELKFESSAKESAEDMDIARVYPFGKRSYKEKKYHDVISPHAALSLAVQSLPTDSMTSLEDGESLNEFLMDCLLTSPSRFPVVFVVDYAEPFPPAFISLSIRLKRYFSFSRLDTGQSSLLRELDLGKLNLQTPAMVVLRSYVMEEKVKYEAVPLRMRQRNHVENDNDEVEDINEFLSYPKLLQFLYNVNSRYREGLPGNNMAEDEEVMTMEDVLDEEKKRFQLTRISRSPALPKVAYKQSGVNIDIRREGKLEL